MTLSGEVSVCIEQQAYRISMTMTDVYGKPVEIHWYAKVIGEAEELDYTGLLIWLYDKNDEPHVEIVEDIVSLAVESKHLLDLHCDSDFSPRMWDTYRQFLIEKYDKIIKDGGLINLNRKVMQEMRNEW